MRIELAGRPLDAGACARWGSAAFSTSSHGPRHAIVDRYVGRVHVRAGETAEAAYLRVCRRLMAYDIFPPSVMHYAICPKGPLLREGSTVVQLVALGPVRLEMATRVVDVWDKQTSSECEAGFRYVTLRGHAECGVETFRLRLDASGGVGLRIEARSRPGLLVTWLGLPVARVLQRALTQAALRRLTQSPKEGGRISRGGR